MLGRRDRYSGNILLYEYLSHKRAPVFLQRNLTRAFRVHQHILTNGDTKEYPGADHELRTKWRPPSWDALDNMVEKEKSKGSFVLDVHGIKPLDRKKTTRAGNENGPAQKTRVLLRLKSIVQVSIFPESSNLPCTSPPSHEAIVQVVEREGDKEVFVEMDPFTIRPEELSSHPRRRVLDKAYKMVLSFNLETRKDAEELWKCMGLKDAPHASSRLSITYKNILECPPGRTSLLLQDHEKQLGLGLEVSMYWSNTNEETILSTHNRRLKDMAEQTSSYPTPPLDVDGQPQFQLTFAYAQETVTTSGLLCPYGGCRGRKPSDFDELQMHLNSWHDHFNHQPIKQKVDDQGVEHWRFECEVSDYRTDQRASDRADEPFDVRVIAPSQPFDRRKYLRGNDEYHRIARLERSAKYTVSRVMMEPTAIPAPLRRRPPDEIQSRPAREKKTYTVPGAPPGVTFFRSISKRPLKEGDQISESDDEVETTWIELRRSAEVDKITGLSDSGKRLLKEFDRYMQEEHLQSDLHAGDALIRFVRARGAWIWQAEAFNEFNVKIDELLEDDIISKEVHARSLEIVNSRKPKSNTQEANELSQRLAELGVQPAITTLSPAGHRTNKRSRLKKDRKGKGKAKVTDTGHLTPITVGSDGDVEMREAPSHTRPNPQPQPENTETDPPYDQCLCGEDALSSSGASLVIVCNNVDCIRRRFHFDCLQKHAKTPLRPLDLRKRTWICDDCKDTSSTAS